MKTQQPVRYAVVGLGYFAQAAILPAFSRLKNARLAALCSGDPTKLKKLGRRYRVTNLLGYDEYDDFVRSGEVDAVYIALPNSMHEDYAVRSSQAGLHVLVEKPMAVSEEQCLRMMAAAREAGTRLMVAYRLHFESATLTLLEAVRAGELGEPRLFDAAFTLQVQSGNTRLRRSTLGGGSLYDLGIYCINAARTVFRDEPIEVTALSARRPDDARFHEVEEQLSVSLRFPRERLASFQCGFGAADVARLQVIGSKGVARMDPAFEHASGLKLDIRSGKRETKRSFRKRDQIAAEIRYFSDCVQRGVEPEPSGAEGLADVRVIEAVYRSLATKRAVELQPVGKQQRPSRALEQFVPAHGMPSLVDVAAPSR